MDKLQKLRDKMDEYKYDYYIIPSTDSHQSEYVTDYYKGRAYISGFTGSAGTLVVGKEEAFLWTDGRYFIQAEHELEGSGIKLMKMGASGYPTITEWIKENVNSSEVLGFDGRTMSKSDFIRYESIASKKDFSIKMDIDLLEEVWEDRPELPKEKIFIHEIEFSGKSVEDKLKEVREAMEEAEGDNYVLASLDDIAWLFNIRGNDIMYNPVALAYAIIEKDTAKLYIDLNKVDNEVKERLNKEGVELKEYNTIYEDVKYIKTSVIIDPLKINAKIYSLIPKKVKVIEKLNITTYLKAIKNEVEIKNIENSQVRDGVACVKFRKWLSENVGKVKVTEVSASDKLEFFRSQGENFKGLSFNTIAGYKEHAAMMHYSATKESDYELKEEGMFLVDSGAQYLDGTTDITRTFVLGKLTEEEKRDFTLVLKSHIALATTKFLKGTPGQGLDAICRRPLWQYGIDYKCGTGHGVGYFLNVHEGPQSIRPISPSMENIPLVPGMIVTNEPGVYKENKFGIRTENILLVQELSKDSEMGEFYEFKTITYCPIDLEGIDASLLSNEEKAWLNDYHSEVYNKISSYLNEDERAYLKYITREI